MSGSKITVNGATWIRRGLVAIAATGMALTSVLAAPSPASAAPRVKEEPTAVIVDETQPIDSKKFDKKDPTPIAPSMLGGGWA